MQFRNNYVKCKCETIQSTLGFKTLDKAAALCLETASPSTDPRQYYAFLCRPVVGGNAGPPDVVLEKPIETVEVKSNSSSSNDDVLTR